MCTGVWVHTPHATEKSLVQMMDDYYWRTPPPREQRSSGTRIIAVIIILMIIISSGLVFILQVGPFSSGPTTKVRVAVLDSGIDIDLSLQGRIVAEKSFIEPQYGYDETDITTTDSRPESVPHGTLVASLVAETPNAQIVNGKVMGGDGAATSIGLVAAMHWAVEQNCTVISMSLGSSPVLGDPLEEAIEWAFDRGVVVVSSAGNEGDSGFAGTSISSPSIFEKCISVAALDEYGNPADYSSTGPTFDRYMKPDISANGWVSYSSSRYYGTSFAAPRVAGAAAYLIGYCLDNDIAYTPGSITVALLKGAAPIEGHPSYIVGTGALDVENSITLIDSSSSDGSLPMLSLVFPAILPIDFERIFFGNTYTFNIRLLTSGPTVFTTMIVGDHPEIYNLPATISVNQSLIIPLTISVPEVGTSIINNTIRFSSVEYGQISLDIEFPIETPLAKIAFDISHTSWDIDSYFGQFREFYKELTGHGISVTELRNSSLTTLTLLQNFDSVVILDPCVYDSNETIPTQVTVYSLPFSEDEKQAYEEYYDAGGGIFLATLGASHANLTQVNEFLNFTGFELTESEIPSGENPVLIDSIESHTITSGVSGFHYLGATLNVQGDGHILARFQPSTPVLGYEENLGGGRIVVTGTNFFIDNYGLLGQYGTGDDALLALQIVQWTAGLL